MRAIPILLASTLLAACSGDTDPASTDEGGGTDGLADGADGADGTDGGLDSADTGGTGPAPCVDTSAEALPDGAAWEDVTWIELDGASDALIDFAGDALSATWTGQYGTYNLNTVPMGSANGFRLERPGRVVAARAQWTHLLDDENTATLYVWNDFGSNGYMWDMTAPAATVTRCLAPEDDGAWVDHVLPEAVAVPQALHVFAGWLRPEGGGGPAIYAEDTYVDTEPYTVGAWFFGVDDALYHRGLATPWYVQRVRLGVIYDEPLDAASKPFQVDALSVSRRAAWGDYDNDGDDDVMTNGPALWRNDGDGTFTNVTTEAVFALASTSGGVWGDYDNDGCLDFFGQSSSRDAGEVLLRNNCDGTLSDATALAGIDDTQTERDCNEDGAPEHAPTEGVAWVDVDNDGWLDLYQANYECSSGAEAYQNYDDRLWRNNGDGSFSDWTEAAGVPVTNQAGRGVTTGDPDRDGDIDVFVSNYRLDRNFYLENIGDGTLVDRAGTNGTIGDLVSGAYGHTIGSAFGDLDGDGDFDLVAANLAHPFYYDFSDRTNLLMNDGDGSFTNEADDRGIYYRETHSNPTLFDADNDGDLDLYISAVYAGRDSDFYRNDGAGSFTLDNHESGLVRQNGWGSAAADFDQDGDVDLLSDVLYRNDAEGLGASLQVTVVGDAGRGGAANRAGIGAVLEATVGDRTLLRHVSGGSGTGVQDSLTQHFGLGSATAVDQLVVYFPGGATVSLDNIDASVERLWVKEDGTTATGWAPPAW